MAWNYRRRIKVIPGVYLNLSKSGVSTSIGVKGASLTLGRKGNYLNTSIPGLGIYNRQKLSSGTKPSNPEQQNTQEPEPLNTSQADNIFSLEPEFITSQTMQGVKEAIIASHEQRLQLQADKIAVKRALSKSKTSLAFSYLFVYGILKPSVSRRIKADMAAQKETIAQIEQEIENSVAKLDFKFENEFMGEYDSVMDSFKKLCTSNKTWDITASHYQDRIATRSAASTVINKKDVHFATREIADIQANVVPLYFQNANGADLYFYPNFVIVFSSREKFAVIGLEEVEFDFFPVRFIETDKVPRDTKVVDRTWAKVNKNGSPDRRFKENYEIPIVQYGGIALKTSTGLYEEYMFSNYEYTERFGKNFLRFQNIIQNLKQV